MNLVFAITFALGAGLAGLGGVIGAVELSMVPGEDTRLLLASLIVVIVGGMGSVVGAAIGAAILGLAETYGLAYAPTYSVVFTFLILILVLAFRPRGIMGRQLAMSAAQWRKAMNSAAAASAAARRRHPRPRDPLRPAAAPRPSPRRRAAGPRGCAARLRRYAARHVSCSLLVLVFPFVASPFVTFQIGAQSLVLGLIALSLTFLGGYGGMVSLAQMTVAGIAGYADGDLRHQRQRRDQPGLAVVAGAAVRAR